MAERMESGSSFREATREFKACLEQEAIALAAFTDNRSRGSFHQSTLLQTHQTSPEDEKAYKEGTHQKILRKSSEPLKAQDHLLREETSEVQWLREGF